MNQRPIRPNYSTPATPDNLGKLGTRKPFNRAAAPLLTLIAAIGVSLPASGQLASKPAGEWIKTLDSSNRVARLKIDETIAKLKIKPGAIIADVGAGSGIFSVPLAKAVAPGGKVYAVDIDQGLIDQQVARGVFEVTWTEAKAAAEMANGGYWRADHMSALSDES